MTQNASFPLGLDAPDARQKCSSRDAVTF